MHMVKEKSNYIHCTFELALLKKIPNENRPSVTPPINPFNVNVACRMPPSCSTRKTRTKDRRPKLLQRQLKSTG